MVNKTTYSALLKYFAVLWFSTFSFYATAKYSDTPTWESVDTKGEVNVRHEAGLINIGTDIYLLGGRRIQPVNRLDTTTNTWHHMAAPPIEFHHFQPVVFDNKIYIAGAMTGGYPHEVPVSHIWIFHPAKNVWIKDQPIPSHRLRGGAGVSIIGNKLYLTGGITDGHWQGTVPWLDEYDLKTKMWRELPDMPNRRDHFQTGIVDNEIYSIGGRITSAKTKKTFSQVVEQVDVYNILTEQWRTLDKGIKIGRAGASTFIINNKVWLVGGESASKVKAHNEVEVYDAETGSWTFTSSLNRGRHGTGLALVNGYLWTASGSGNRGGAPELKSTEKIKIN